MIEQSLLLNTLTRAPVEPLKLLADELIPLLEPIEVIQNRTGLAMLPMREPAQGSTFYLGEVLIAEAHVRVGATEGYAACLGRDLEQALAIALIDAAFRAAIAVERITDFVQAQAAALAAADADLMQTVAQTRVDLETY
jgi:alpha-D-ribose 1-methylphosphonate 5-triphosphate synthase subunit PhnG